LPVADAADADGDDDGVVEPELLPQAAASRVSGTRAAAVHAKRIRWDNWEYSFAYARFRVR